MKYKLPLVDNPVEKRNEVAQERGDVRSGALLTLPGARRGGGKPIISAATFGVVIMAIVTTLLTPPALKWALGKKSDRARSTVV